MSITCKVDGCNVGTYAKGYCGKHYQRVWHRGSTETTREYHGLRKTSEYTSWSHAKERCYNKNCLKYSSHGGRGISVCASWKKSFKSFYEDMGAKPGTKYSIDRVDNDKGYWCGHCIECKKLGQEANCRWATNEMQANNTRSNKYHTYKGKSLTIQQWSRLLNIDHRKLGKYLNNGQTIDNIIERS